MSDVSTKNGWTYSVLNFSTDLCYVETDILLFKRSHNNIIRNLHNNMKIRNG